MMNKNIKTLLLALLPLVAGLIIGFMSAPKQDKAYQKLLQKQIKEYAATIDTLQRRFVILSVELSKAELQIEEYKKGVQIENQKTEYWRNRYENSKTTPISISDQHELDSLLNSLYPEGHNED